MLVDSSVWINYLGICTSDVEERVETLVRPTNQVVTTGIILQEVLQGIRNHRSYQLTYKLLGKLPFLNPTTNTHAQAAELFRLLTQRGITSTTVDVLIATLAMQHNVLLFTLDTGFKAIAHCSKLQLLN